jgi:hypothetical protein
MTRRLLERFAVHEFKRWRAEAFKGGGGQIEL